MFHDDIIIRSGDAFGIANCFCQFEMADPVHLAQSLCPSGGPWASLTNEYEDITNLIYQLPSVRVKSYFSNSRCRFTSLLFTKTVPLSCISRDDEPGF
jgi:hypothetical protein